MKKKNIHLQSGTSLLEVMIAIVVAGLGILGILGLQAKTLVDNQAGLQRAQAIRLIEDLSERISINPNSLLDKTIKSYAIDWSTSKQDDDDTEEDPLINSIDWQCGTDCSPEKFAENDIKRWQNLVKATLHEGNASVFLPETKNNEPHRQIGVIISWKASQDSRDSASSSNHQSVQQAMSINGSDIGSKIICPSGSICYSQFIALKQRCLTDAYASNGSALYCASGN